MLAGIILTVCVPHPVLKQSSVICSAIFIEYLLCAMFSTTGWRKGNKTDSSGFLVHGTQEEKIQINNFHIS